MGSLPLEWSYSSDDVQYGPVRHDRTNVVGQELTISRVKKFHRGYYRCTLNNVSFTVLLRVKGKRCLFCSESVRLPFVYFRPISSAVAVLGHCRHRSRPSHPHLDLRETPEIRQESRDHR